MVSCEQAFQGQRPKGVRDDGLRGFGGKSFSPKLRKEVEAEFEDLFSFLIGPEPAAAGEFPIFQNKDRPVLEFVGKLVGDFARQAFENLRLGKWSAKGAGDFGVSPKFDSKRDVFDGPRAET